MLGATDLFRYRSYARRRRTSSRLEDFGCHTEQVGDEEKMPPGIFSSFFGRDVDLRIRSGNHVRRTGPLNTLEGDCRAATITAFDRTGLRGDVGDPDVPVLGDVLLA